MQKVKRGHYKKESKRLTRNLVVRMRQQEIEDLYKRAEEADMTVAEFVREHMNLINKEFKE